MKDTIYNYKLSEEEQCHGHFVSANWWKLSLGQNNYEYMDPFQSSEILSCISCLMNCKRVFPPSWERNLYPKYFLIWMETGRNKISKCLKTDRIMMWKVNSKIYPRSWCYNHELIKLIFTVFIKHERVLTVVLKVIRYN